MVAPALDPSRTAYAVIRSPDPGHTQEEFLVRHPYVDLGRAAKNDPPAKCALGDNQAISRQHARVAWDAALGAWNLTVQGKNGVVVNTGPLITPACPPHPVASRDVLSIGDRRIVWHGPAPGWPVLGGDGVLGVAGEGGGGGIGD